MATKKKQAKRPVKKRVIKRPIKKKAVKKKPVVKKRVVRKPVKKTTAKRKSPSGRSTAGRPAKKKLIKKRKTNTWSSLEQIFESSVKVQVMKLFFRNPEDVLLLSHIIKRLRLDSTKVKKEVKKLEKAGFLKTKQVSARKQSYFLNLNFDFFNELQELILKSAPISKERMVKSIRKIGKIKLILLSGILVGENISLDASETTRADLLIVGDRINQRKLGTLIKDLEAEAGAEINCVVLDSEEFNYRYNMYDRFIRDLLTEKSEILINKLDISIL